MSDCDSDLVRSLNDQLTAHQEALDRVIAERDHYRAEAIRLDLAVQEQSQARAHIAAERNRLRRAAQALADRYEAHITKRGSVCISGVEGAPAEWRAVLELLP